jgi:uncharacterized membrane protein YcjF (UPF0283 family)
MAVHEMPPTRGARQYKKLLGAAWIGAIIGGTIAALGLLDTVLDSSFSPPATVWRKGALNTTLLVGWAIIAWIAYRGTRRNLAPPEWVVLGVVVLVWVAILLL